jgi:hypothetical protein
MPIRDTPAQCDIGDGVLVSNVLQLDGFLPTATIVQFYPDVVREPSLSAEPVKIDVPKPWIFVRRAFRGDDRTALPVWRREQ